MRRSIVLLVLFFIATSALANRKGVEAGKRKAADEYIRRASPGWCPEAPRVRLVWSETSTRGEGLLRYQQLFRGVPVENTAVRIEIDPAGAIRSTEELQCDLSISVVPRISASAAKAIAAKSISPEGNYVAHDKGLVIVPRGFVVESSKPITSDHLAWLIVIDAENPVGGWRCYVDAQTGEFLGRWSTVRFGR